tara:strand:+ start:3765 stop:4019 length:255 start_codon:yes stop_codon:yes gene_type:complete
MKTSWTAYIKDPERKEEIRKSFNSSVVMRKRLKEMLERKIHAKITACQSENLYESPNWALLQADSRGYERAMNDVIKLLEEKEK